MESVTVVIVPRERFGMAPASLDSVLRHTPASTPVLYVDGGSPAPVRRAVERRAAQRSDIAIVSVPRYLSPNEARNLALARVRTSHVVFLDNDCIVEEGWLERMMACARDTGAAAVIPVLCWENGLVHAAGNVMRIEVAHGKRRLRYQLVHEDEPLEKVRGRLERRRVDAIEFHCVLLRVDTFEKTGPFDEKMLSTREHCDFSLALWVACAEVFLEPGTVVHCLRPPPLEWSDVPYYLLRWSPQWNDASLRHLNDKWNLQDDYEDFTETWLTPVRARALQGMQRRVSRVAGAAIAAAIARSLERFIIRFAMLRRSG